MKSQYSIWLLSCIVLLFSCGKSSERQARELIGRSIEAHGGAEAWENINSLKFLKKTRLTKEDGTVEGESEERIEFRFKPYLEGVITWEKDSIKHVSTWDGVQMDYFMGENEVKNVGFLASKRKEFDAALHAVAQPWQLLDGETVPKYEGQKTLENGRLVESIRIEGGTGGDIRYYYFDPKSAVMVGSEVRMTDQITLIYNLGYLEIEGLKLQGQVDSWRIDQNGEKLYLCAEYLYSEYEITN